MHLEAQGTIQVTKSDCFTEIQELPAIRQPICRIIEQSRINGGHVQGDLPELFKSKSESHRSQWVARVSRLHNDVAFSSWTGTSTTYSRNHFHFIVFNLVSRIWSVVLITER